MYTITFSQAGKEAIFHFTSVLICLFKNCRNRKVEPINSGPCCPDELKRDDKT